MASSQLFMARALAFRLARTFSVSCRLLVGASKMNATDYQLFSKLPVTSLAHEYPNPLAYRKFLSGSNSKGFPEYLSNPREGLPYSLKANSTNELSIEELAQKCRDELDEALPAVGVVLFRGLPVNSAKEFSAFCKGLGYQSMGYEGGTGNRTGVDEEAHVYTSTNDPKEYSIELHNEMACSTVYPRKVILYCLQAPGDNCGGLTPIAKNAEIFARLDRRIIKRLTERKIRYHRYLTDQATNPYASWQSSFFTDDRQDVEKFLEAAGFDYKWGKENNLFYWYTIPPFVPHPVTGQLMWFSQPTGHHNSYLKDSPMFQGVDLPNHMYPFHTTYGDGSEFEPEVIEHIRVINWQCAVGFQWRHGDVLVIDNFAVMHGRLSFSGERKILAHLTRD